MAFDVKVTLTSAGEDLSTFDLYADNTSSLLESDITKAELLNGHVVTVPDGTGNIIVKSTDGSTCINYLTLEILNVYELHVSYGSSSADACTNLDAGSDVYYADSPFAAAGDITKISTSIDLYPLPDSGYYAGYLSGSTTKEYFEWTKTDSGSGMSDGLYTC